jgi:hypothetical protein
VAQCHAAGLADAVVADPEMGVGNVLGGMSFEIGGEDLGRRSPPDAAVGSGLVVVGDETVELGL